MLLCLSDLVGGFFQKLIREGFVIERAVINPVFPITAPRIPLAVTLAAHGIPVIPGKTAAAVFAFPSAERLFLQKLHDLFGQHALFFDDLIAVQLIEPLAVAVQKIENTVLLFELFHGVIVRMKVLHQNRGNIGFFIVNEIQKQIFPD